ncbi:MAG: hypothetical protein IT460_15175 [Planctomycetes bacterium]|nr:hypothetical protein [Planctomycetota bacterium]
MRRSTFPLLSRLARLAFVAVAAAATAGCVSARTEGGALQMRLSRFADEAEVDALAKRVDGTDAALKTFHDDQTAAIAQLREDGAKADAQLRADLTAADEQIRKDLVAQQQASQAAFEQAIAAGKSQADAVREAAAAGVQQATALAVTAKGTAEAAAQRAGQADVDAKARADAFADVVGKRLDAESRARQEQYTKAIDETRGSKWNWYEIALYALGGGAIVGPAATRVVRGSPLRSGAGALKAYLEPGSVAVRRAPAGAPDSTPTPTPPAAAA